MANHNRPSRGKENASSNPVPRAARSPYRHLTKPPPTPPKAVPKAPSNLSTMSEEVADWFQVLRGIAAISTTPSAARTLPDSKLDEALQAATKLNHPSLLRLSVTILARISLFAHCAESLCHPLYLSVLDAALGYLPTRAASATDLNNAREAWRLAARALRNMAAFSADHALAIARHSKLVRLLVASLRAALVPRPRLEAVECAAAIANFVRCGLDFQAYVRKHDGIPVLCAAAHQPRDSSLRFHACRALAEFSRDQKWLVLLISERCVYTMLHVIETERDEEVVSESTRFLGNLATSKIGREAVISAEGLDKVVMRVMMGSPSRRSDGKGMELNIDLLRTAANLCVNSKSAANRLINLGGIMAYIEAYGDNDDQSAPLQTEAFRGLLIIAQGGHGFRAVVLREIGIKIRQDTGQGRCVAHLYDLSRRIKVEASTERNDDFPQTIAALGERSRQYLFQAGPLATESRQVPNSVPDMQSPNTAAFRQSGRVLSVQRPVLHRERLQKERRERPPRMPRQPQPEQIVPQPEQLRQSPQRPRSDGSSPRRGGIVSDPGQNAKGGSLPSARGPKIPGYNEADNVDHIPRCKVIEKGQGKDEASNIIMAVWSAVCNVVTRPQHMPRPGGSGMAGGRKGNIHGDGVDENGEDIFEIGVPLGRGGFATVYLAENLRTKELVAVKRFHPLNSTTPDARRKAEMAARRAMKEQRIWDGLSHKNVVSYRGCFFGENGELNLVAEYIPGWSLADHLAQVSRFPEHMVACITQQIVDGLDYLHKMGITHRDVKPANILVNPDGMIKITDFGVSSAVDVPTMTGNTLVGTPWYIAPEMIEGRPYGKSVDIWSLGCTVMELATGKRPYHNLRPHVAMFSMTKDRMPPIPKKLSPALRDFLKTCWVWDPAQRPTPANLRRHPFLASVVRPEVRNLKNMTRKA